MMSQSVELFISDLNVIGGLPSIGKVIMVNIILYKLSNDKDNSLRKKMM